MKAFLKNPLSIFHNTRWFQKAAVTITLAFSFMLVLVTWVAFLRPSGSTGIDAAKMQQMRQQNQLTEKEIEKR